MKKIAIISHGASGGGSERVATILANYLSKKYEVYFYAIHSPGREYYLDEKIKYEYCDVSGKYGFERMIKRSFKLRKYIKKNGMDIVISFIYLEGTSLLLNNKVKKIYTLRNDPNSFYNSGLPKILRDLVYRNADAVVFQTPDAKSYFGDKVQSHGMIIPNPIKENLPLWNRTEHNKEILAVGRLSPQKNFPMLINAFAEFSKFYPEYQLTICGEGQLKDDLVRLATKLGVVDKINLPGFTSNVHERMTKAEIYVSTSDYEGISNSMLEALAIGIPTICTDCPVGGARMFIKNDSNGYLVGVGDVIALTECLKRLAESNEKQIEFYSKSIEIRQELDVNKICGMWEALICSLEE